MALGRHVRQHRLGVAPGRSVPAAHEQHLSPGTACRVGTADPAAGSTRAPAGQGRLQFCDPVQGNSIPGLHKRSSAVQAAFLRRSDCLGGLVSLFCWPDTDAVLQSSRPVHSNWPPPRQPSSMAACWQPAPAQSGSARRPSWRRRCRPSGRQGCRSARPATCRTWRHTSATAGCRTPE